MKIYISERQGISKVIILTIFIICFIFIFSTPVFSAYSEGEYTNPDKNTIISMILADYDYPSSQHHLDIYNWSLKKVNKILFDFEDQYAPYCSMYNAVFAVKCGACITIAFVPNKIKECIANSKKNAASMKKVAKKIVNNKMSAKQKAMAIQRYVSKAFKYNEKIFSLNKALQKKKGNCTAFTSYYNALCAAAGLEARRCEGSLFDSDEWGGHAWNKVKIDNSWYYVDYCLAQNFPEYAWSKTLWNDHILDS